MIGIPFITGPYFDNFHILQLPAYYIIYITLIMYSVSAMLIGITLLDHILTISTSFNYLHIT